MANCRNRNCGCYGALSSVYNSGNWNVNRCGCPCCGRRRCEEYPVLTEQTYGLFATGGGITAAAGGTVPFVAVDADRDYYTVNNGSVVIRRPGLYAALYNANIPAGNAVTTALSLNLNGAALNSGGLDVATTADTTTSNFSAMSIFTADYGDTVNLSTLNALSVPTAGATPVSTLALIKLS